MVPPPAQLAAKTTLPRSAPILVATALEDSWPFAPALAPLAPALRPWDSEPDSPLPLQPLLPPPRLTLLTLPEGVAIVTLPKVGDEGLRPFPHNYVPPVSCWRFPPIRRVLRPWRSLVTPSQIAPTLPRLWS